MAKFIIRCLIFLLPVMAFLVGLEAYSRFLPNSYKQKYEWMQDNAKDVEVLVLGNSHGLFGVKPDAFSKKTYNLCNVSQLFEYDEYLLRQYVFRCGSLTDVILIADNSNMFDLPLEQTDEWFRCIYYRLYMDYPKHSLMSKYGFEVSDISALKQKLLHNHSTDGIDSLGWNGSYSVDRRKPENFSSAAAIRHRCRDWKAAAENRKILSRIISLCKSNDIRLILVQAPVTKMYYDQIDKRQLDYIRKYYKRQRGIIVADYSQDKRFTDNDFFDSDHLADVGAEKWSKILNDDFFKALP